VIRKILRQGKTEIIAAQKTDTSPKLSRKRKA